ncbi:MAG TPA: bifunctional adenosylcobinamide kinase/adenosylcobinamide-phosphate guanylyltransferase [Thermoanaerobaculia bacterium]
MVTLILGGARSGKSRYALELAARHVRPAFVATAEPLDDEMRDRIRHHREEREESCFTLEEPVDLAGALGRLPDGTGIAIVDCLTVWLGNLVHRRGAEGLSGNLEDFGEVAAFLGVIDDPPCPVVVVSNEVGLGGVSDNALARTFTDLLGRLNQKVAARAQRVVLLISGLPLVLKGEPE